MNPVKGYPIRRYDNGAWKQDVDAIASEARIEVDVNDGALTLGLLCLPRDMEALAVGFLMGEGALQRYAQVASVTYLPDERKVAVRGDFDATAMDNLRRRWTRGTGCGSGGTSLDLATTPLASAGPGLVVAPERLLELAKAFQERGDLWRTTGSVHGCALSDGDDILYYAEDVGRHNALDKVMGMAVMEGASLDDKLVITSGRLSSEIVSKAITCRIPMLVSRSAVTNMSIKLAARAGLTLVGFLRGRRLNVYTGQERVATEPS